IKLEPGADLTLLENGPAAARFNKVLEVEIGDGARFHHIRSQGRDHERQAATHIFARLGAEATFKSFTLTVNGRLTRNEVFVEMQGDNATTHIAGAAMGDGADDPFHHDDTVFVVHDALNCESRQVFKKVLRNGAVGVFQGKILVKPGAQKTDGYQKSQALLLDDDSQFLAKPELEIYADDVACSHGSTSGAIDEEALFYLQSRLPGAARRVRQAVVGRAGKPGAGHSDGCLPDDLSGAATVGPTRRGVSARGAFRCTDGSGAVPFDLHCASGVIHTRLDQPACRACLWQ
ncbi:MAG: SufD family Fe-S cluster assembly protein, partial [Maritimibacter sp.]